MTIIETLATILAVLTLVKMVTILINPRFWIKLTEPLIKTPALFSAIYLISAIVVGYYLLQIFTIVEIGAVMLFCVLLFGISILPFFDADAFLKMREEFLGKGLKKCWLLAIIWAVFALWILFEIFIRS